jgi:putative NIF3 family GTP cyclohydrolase 1 type 2
VGKLFRAQEVRLEVLAPESRLQAALARLQEAHPYEEPAYDLYPLQNPGAPLGLGRVGRWRKPKPFPRVLSQIKKLFGVKTVKVWGHPPPEVQRLAVCGGSGGELISAAQGQGAQIYLTGEVRHHQVPAGALKDFAVLEVGHFASEAVFMEPWAAQLRGLFDQAGVMVQVEVATGQTSPFSYW